MYPVHRHFSGKTDLLCKGVGIGRHILLHGLLLDYVERNSLSPVPGINMDPGHLASLVKAHVQVGAVLILDNAAYFLKCFLVVPLDLGFA